LLKVAGDYSWSGRVEEYLSLYRGLLDSGNAP